MTLHLNLECRFRKLPTLICLLDVLLNTLKHSGHYMYRTVVTTRTARVNIQQFYIPPTQCIYVFFVDLRTNSDYFPIQH